MNWTGAPGSPKRTWAENDWAQPYNCFLQEVQLRYQLKAFEKFLFGPGTLGRTWGTRPAFWQRLVLRHVDEAQDEECGQQKEHPVLAGGLPAQQAEHRKGRNPKRQTIGN